MVRVKEKKAKGDEAFTKRKQKVGRKKLAPATATKAEVHARTLRIDVQKVVAAEQSKLPPVAPSPGSPLPSHTMLGSAAVVPTSAAETLEDLHRTINESIIGIVHYRAPSRKAALASCLRWLQNKHSRNGLVAPVRTVQLLDKALNAMVDTDDEVRVAAREVVQHILAKTMVDAPNMVSSIAGTVLRKFNIAITHAERGARVGCVELLSKVLTNEEDSWLAGPSDAEEKANFLACIVHTQPHLHREALQLLESTVGVVKSCKCWTALSAVARSFVHAPRCYGGMPSVLATCEAVRDVLTDVATFTFSLFKELLETRQALFGFRDKHTMAVQMAHTLAVLLRAQVDAGASLPFDKKLQIEVRHAFVEAVPFSFEDLCARGTQPAIRLVVAVAAVACPLLLSGQTSVLAPTVTALKHLVATKLPQLAPFTVYGIRTLVAASEQFQDPGCRDQCRVAAAAMLYDVPVTFATLLKAATLGQTTRSRGQLELCVDVLRDTMRLGLFARLDARADRMPLVEVVKALFMNRDAALENDDMEVVVRGVVELLSSAACSRYQQISEAELSNLSVVVASLFGIPAGPTGDLVEGVLKRCSPMTRTQAAAVAIYLGATPPPSYLQENDGLRYAVDWLNQSISE